METTRCGSALAVGALPLSFIAGQLSHIVTSLVAAAEMTSKNALFVLSRRDCLKALTWYYCSLLRCFYTDKDKGYTTVYIYARSASILNASRLWYQQHAAFHT